jgi:hypothetical protein
LQDINPRKIEWKLNKELKLGIRFAETRLSDLILQNEVNVLEFDHYGKSFIVDMKLSPDAFVQVRQKGTCFVDISCLLGRSGHWLLRDSQTDDVFAPFFSRWHSKPHTMICTAKSNAPTNQVNHFMPTVDHHLMFKLTHRFH